MFYDNETYAISVLLYTNFDKIIKIDSFYRLLVRSKLIVKKYKHSTTIIQLLHLLV